VRGSAFFRFVVHDSLYSRERIALSHRSGVASLKTTEVEVCQCGDMRFRLLCCQALRGAAIRGCALRITQLLGVMEGEAALAFAALFYTGASRGCLVVRRSRAVRARPADRVGETLLW